MHGGIPGDGVSMIDGMRIGNMYLSSNLTNMSLSALIYDEVNIRSPDRPLNRGPTA